jgi:nitroreductase
MGVEPYVRIYVFGPEEVALYNWSRHSLLQVEEGDWRSRVNPQGFARAASHILVFVSDKTPLQGKGGIPEVWDKWLGVATGAMTQDIYLAADALGIGARYAETMDQPFLREILTIPSGEAPLAILALGKR